MELNLLYAGHLVWPDYELLECTMNLELTPVEQRLLVDILSNHLSELRMEISNTENFDLRQALKEDEATLKGLLARLGESREAGV